MPALREQPRVTVVKALSVALLVAIGAGIATLLDGGDQHRVDALEIRMASARHSLTAQGSELRTVRAGARRADVAANRAERS